VWITRRDFELETARLLDRMDQPSIDGVNTYFVALAARRAGLKVALSGLGGDELFGGYPSFRQVPRLVATVGRASNARFGKALRVVSAPLFRRVSSPKYASLLEYGADYAGAYMLRRALFLPWEVEELLDADLAREGLKELDTLGQLARTADAIESPRLKVSGLEATWYMRNQLLRDTDWASMSHSVEVRVPLVDWQLWSEMVPLLNANPWVGKHELAMTPRVPLPDSVVLRPKTGFVTPTRDWTAGKGESRERGLRQWAQKVYRAA
jgi:asparagine synthase (glutamine-hydrolysing)